MQCSSGPDHKSNMILWFHRIGLFATKDRSYQILLRILKVPEFLPKQFEEKSKLLLQTFSVLRELVYGTNIQDKFNKCFMKKKHHFCKILQELL